MRPSQLVTYAVFAGICLGAGLWMCLQNTTPMLTAVGAAGIIVGGVGHLALMALADRVEQTD